MEPGCLPSFPLMCSTVQVSFSLFTSLFNEAACITQPVLPAERCIKLRLKQVDKNGDGGGGIATQR